MDQQIIDLTLTLYHGLRGVEIYPNTSFDKEGFNTTNLHLYSHAGTHMDAPRHFFNDGDTIDHWPLEKCIGPALVIDMSHKAPNSFLTVEDLGETAARIGSGSRVLLRTDWHLHAEAADYRTHFPRISIELAQWFAEKGIWLVGVEMPSVASIQHYDELRAVHQTLLGAKIVIVECLANMQDLPEEIYFIATPLKVQAGDGSPVRAVAVINPNHNLGRPVSKV